MSTPVIETVKLTMSIDLPVGLLDEPELLREFAEKRVPQAFLFFAGRYHEDYESRVNKETA